MSYSNCILYAEDDENDAFLLQHAFKQAGINVALQIVNSGQKAIDYLSGQGPFAERSRYPLPGLVVLDLKMPHKTGMNVLEWIRRQPDLRTMVVIIYTASHDKGDVDRAYELGANSFIVKPSDLHHMVELARALKAWWLDRNQFSPIVAR